MQKPKNLLLILFIVLFFAAVGRLVWNADQKTSFFLKPQTSTRVTASVSPQEKYFAVKIEAVGGIPDNNEQELTLKGRVTLLKKTQGDIEYHWILPPEAQVVSGDPKDSWANLDVGQTAEAQITLTGLSRENASGIVILHVENELNGEVKVGNSAVFSPNPESVSLSSKPE